MNTNDQAMNSPTSERTNGRRNMRTGRVTALLTALAFASGLLGACASGSRPIDAATAPTGSAAPMPEPAAGGLLIDPPTTVAASGSASAQPGGQPAAQYAKSGPSDDPAAIAASSPIGSHAAAKQRLMGMVGSLMGTDVTVQAKECAYAAWRAAANRIEGTHEGPDPIIPDTSLVWVVMLTGPNLEPLPSGKPAASVTYIFDQKTGLLRTVIAAPTDNSPVLASVQDQDTSSS